MKLKIKIKVSYRKNPLIFQRDPYSHLRITSKKYWGQIRGRIRLILVYGEFPRLKILLLTKPNIQPCISGFTNSRVTFLTQGVWESGASP